MPRVLIALLVLGSMALAACGGGGGGGGAPPPPPPQSQSIAFAESGTLYKFLGDAAYSNVAAGGAGTGAITYASSAPAVATVESQTGRVTITGLGSAQITASKAADASYLAAQASYTLRVAPRSVRVTAWAGSSDAEVSFAAEASSLDFTRSSDLQCDPVNYTACADGTQSALTSTAFVEPLARLQQSAMYWLKHGPHVTRGVAVPERKFADASVNNAVTFAARVWVAARTDWYEGEIWSTDGLNWRLESAQVPLNVDSRLVVFKNELWLIGADPSANTARNIWKSTDGKTWTAVPQTAGFPVRYYFSATAFNGRLWIAGGAVGSAPYNDVWSSEDGSTWTEVTAAAAFPARSQHAMVTFGGRMWIIGGANGAMLPDVWSSTDGATWSEETAAAAFGPRFSHGLTADDSRMWLIAGRDAYQSVQRDVWSSTDGKTWTQATDHAEFSLRDDPGVTVFGGRLWVVGGDNAWSSATGAEWSKVSASAVIPGLGAETSVAFKDRLYVLGDERQLWSSADGFSWTEEVRRMPGFATTSGAAGGKLLVLGERMILIGGLQYAAPNYIREAYESIDGKAWSKIGELPFPGDMYQEVVELNGKLFAFAGTYAAPYTVEVWSSADAANWTRVSAQAAFSPRAGVRVLAYKNLLWATGGVDAASVGKSDVWSSPNGVNWTPVGSTTGLPARAFGPGIALSDRMCVYGNWNDLYGPSDAWCSSDGATWEKKGDDSPNGPVALLNGSVWVVGDGAAPFRGEDLVWKSTDGFSWRLGYQSTMQFP